ncbi:phosphatase PAP2 family protein [Microbacteriaceae bacterium 4G12]
MKILNQIKKNLIPLSCLISIALLGLVYPLFNSGERGAHNLTTTIDQSIPFIKVFVIPYMTWLPFVTITLIYFCFKDKKLYYKTMITYNLCLILCYIVYFYFQTTVPFRPTITENDILSNIVAHMYASDQPFNCFPSIHCLTSYLMIVALRTSTFQTKWNRFFIYGYATTIIFSTFFVKQHVILDAIGAIILAEIVFWTVNYVFETATQRVPQRSEETAKQYVRN